MMRSIGAVLLGYLTMFALVFGCFTAAFLILGPNGAFEPGTFDISPTWIVVWFVVSLAAAIAGGFVCARISKMPKPPIVLAGIVFVLGLLSAIPVLTTTVETRERPAEVSNMDAMMNARQPTWIALATPVLGAFGVLVGARMRRV